METRLYADDTDGALRAADRAGGTAPAIAKARIAVIKKAANAKGLLDGLPADARREPGYIFSRAQLLARADKAAEAADLILSLPHDQAQASDADQWWVERRLIARKLLDLGKAKTAYRLLREAAPPHKENYRVDQDFTCGWIALHFLHEPAAALAHFAQIAHASKNPIALARSGYWQGLAAEALGRKEEAKGHFETAARYPTAYYGQIARARLGHHDIALRPPPQPRDLALPGDQIGGALRYTDRNAILARSDLKRPSFSVDHVETNVFAAYLPFTPELNVIAGWIALDVHVGGRQLRLATTHLETPIVGVPEATLVQMAQAQELIDAMQGVMGPVVICGDFNSDANHGGFIDDTPTVGLIEAAGYEEVWPATHGRGDLGLTWPFYLEDQFPAPPFFADSKPFERIDLFFGRGMPAVRSERVIGPVQGHSMPPYASDHAGVIATFRFGD